MRRSLLSLALPALVFACSTRTAGTAPPPDADAGASCPDGVPSSLSVSEGGRATLPRVAGVTYEASGGLVLSDDGDAIAVRAPYLSTAGQTALTASCGRTIPVTLRPLTWTRLASWTEDTGANAREYGAWWIDPTGAGALVVFGGYHYVPAQYTPSNDAWRFDFGASTWTQLHGDALPTMPGGRAAPIPGARAVLYFGGTLNPPAGNVETQPSLYRLDFDDATMRAAPVPNLANAPGSYTGSFFYDAKRSRWLSVCGLDTSTGLNCDVTAYTEARGFERVATKGSAPAGRYGFDYGLDEANDRVIIFGGMVGPNNPDQDGETWALELGGDTPEWKLLFANGAGPTKRRNGAFAMDPVGRRFFVWGGTPDGAASVPGLQVLTLDRGAEAWTDLPTPDVPSRTSGFAVHDAAHGRILMGFGNRPTPMRDLWSLDVANDAP